MIEKVRSLTLPARDFEPVGLSMNDHLPVDMMLLGAFHGLIDFDTLASALEGGLAVFPHLTGHLDSDQGTIMPGDDGLEIELARIDQKIEQSLLEQTPIESLKEHLIPHPGSVAPGSSLFGVRVVHVPRSEITLIGLRVSHCAVDGAGLALFLRACMLSMAGREQLSVHHGRDVLRGAGVDQAVTMPAGYQPLKTKDQSSPGKKGESLVFTVSIKEIIAKWKSPSHLDARIRLAAWLSAECARARPELSELAVWCDVRGLQGVPRNFTGNCGCFLHFPLLKSLEAMTEHWRALVKRKGFARVARVFSQLQAAEATGAPLQWQDDDHVLQINLVPHTVAGVDFGSGRPFFGMVLARNSRGIRLSTAPDERKFLVEIELPGDVGHHLMAAAAREGFAVEQWGKGDTVLSLWRP